MQSEKVNYSGRFNIYILQEKWLKRDTSSDQQWDKTMESLERLRAEVKAEPLYFGDYYAKYAKEAEELLRKVSSRCISFDLDEILNFFRIFYRIFHQNLFNFQKGIFVEDRAHKQFWQWEMAQPVRTDASHTAVGFYRKNLNANSIK